MKEYIITWVIVSVTVMQWGTHTNVAGLPVDTYPIKTDTNIVHKSKTTHNADSAQAIYNELVSIPDDNYFQWVDSVQVVQK